MDQLKAFKDRMYKAMTERLDFYAKHIGPVPKDPDIGTELLIAGVPALRFTLFGWFAISDTTDKIYNLLNETKHRERLELAAAELAAEQALAEELLKELSPSE